MLTLHNGFHSKSNVGDLSKSRGGRGLIGVHVTSEIAVLGLRIYVRTSKERLLIVACTTEGKQNREISIEYKKMEKEQKGKYSGHKNNCMENLSGKQCVKQVKIGGDG